jgi:hypothetical protein
MIAQGRVVVLDKELRLPEGQEVTVLVPVAAPPSSGKRESPHSILDVPTVSVGAALRPLASDDDLLGEMLEGRR